MLVQPPSTVELHDVMYQVANRSFYKLGNYYMFHVKLPMQMPNVWLQHVRSCPSSYDIYLPSSAISEHEQRHQAPHEFILVMSCLKT